MGKKQSGKKHDKKKGSHANDDMIAAQKRLEDRVELMERAMVEFEEALGGTQDLPVSWFLYCERAGLSMTQSKLLLTGLSSLLKACISNISWAPHAPACLGENGLEFSTDFDATKGERGPAYDVEHVRLVMRSVILEDDVARMPDSQVTGFMHAIESMAIRGKTLCEPYTAVVGTVPSEKLVCGDLSTISEWL
ncbi:hypothetical protein [Bifidobacterium sp. ESL0790]|uniref:hypothetical protein n=1 Tax=Bifidobacterium sp. ESL0790 TaxID=2983233 RepID=UPI0023F72245|nr:hypothetical protein [Bifidobacterium sp. ESL0790]WEV72293.1 hypothetical protein OZY47_07665 [Bifidobacterium sp. ESL0790]